MLANMQGYLLKPGASNEVSPPSPASSNTLPTMSNLAHSGEETHDILLKVKRRLAVTSDLQQVVEQRTKPQSKCPLGDNYEATG